MHGSKMRSRKNRMNGGIAKRDAESREIPLRDLRLEIVVGPFSEQ